MRPVLQTRHRIGRRGLLAAAGGLLTSPAIVRAQGSNGVALVIGNSKYKWEAALPNVRRDAPDVAKRFQAMGLKTELVQDAGQDAMFAAIDKFKAAASGAELVVLYYAGHGASWDQDTYLVPVDADLSTPEIVRTLPPVAAVSAAMKGAAHRLLVFDNCRNNPADGWRQRAAATSSVVSAAELAATKLHGPNTLVLFSTAPGRIALDGPSGANSPFAAAFLRQLEDPSIDLAALPAKLRRDLLIATDGQQVIWDESTYTGPYTIKGVRNGAGRGSSSSISPSRIVELPKAYAFAQEKKLSLPPGLVAIRSPNGGPGDQKIGAFASTFKVSVGNTLGTSIEPILVLVLSVDDSGAAQTILCGRIHGFERNGASWAFFRGQMSGNKIEYSPNGPPVQVVLTWKDANAGTYDMLRDGPFAKRSSDRFTRLDG